MTGHSFILSVSHQLHLPVSRVAILNLHPFSGAVTPTTPNSSVLAGDVRPEDIAAMTHPVYCMKAQYTLIIKINKTLPHTRYILSPPSLQASGRGDSLSVLGSSPPPHPLMPPSTPPSLISHFSPSFFSYHSLPSAALPPFHPS